MRDYMARRVTPLRRVTPPTWGPPPPCKQALNVFQANYAEKFKNVTITARFEFGFETHMVITTTGFSPEKLRV